MKNLTVNDKGSIGVAKVVADLLSQGFYVFLPFDGSSPVDLVVADKSMRLRRLQIKYRIVERGMIRIPLSSVVNGTRVPIDLSKIDGWAVYSPDANRVYYISARSFGPHQKWFNIALDDGRHLASIFWES